MLEARRLLERALAINDRALEPGHPLRVRSREALAEHCSQVPSLAGAELREPCRRLAP